MDVRRELFALIKSGKNVGRVFQQPPFVMRHDNLTCARTHWDTIDKFGIGRLLKSAGMTKRGLHANLDPAPRPCTYDLQVIAVAVGEAKECRGRSCQSAHGTDDGFDIGLFDSILSLYVEQYLGHLLTPTTEEF